MAISTPGTLVMIVLKFGGTSVGSLERVRDAASIIEAQPLPRAAVVSAAGGVTNLLLDAAEHAANGDAEGASPLIDEIVARHARIADGIGDARERAAVNELL